METNIGGLSRNSCSYARPSNPRLDQIGRRTADHGQAARAAGRSTAGRKTGSPVM